MKVAYKMKLIRKQLGLSQKQFASNLDISQSCLSMIESGTNGLTVNLIGELSKKYSVNPNWFFFDTAAMFLHDGSLSSITRKELATDFVDLYNLLKAVKIKAVQRDMPGTLGTVDATILKAVDLYFLITQCKSNQHGKAES